MSESHDEPRQDKTDLSISDDEQELEETDDGDTETEDEMPDGISPLLDVGTEE